VQIRVRVEVDGSEVMSVNKLIDDVEVWEFVEPHAPLGSDPQSMAAFELQLQRHNSFVEMMSRDFAVAFARALRSPRR
jgi:hypothetical protein